MRHDGYVGRPDPPSQVEPERDFEAAAPAPSPPPPAVSETDGPTPPQPQGSPSPDPQAQPETSTEQQRFREALHELEAAKRRVERDAQRVKEETQAQLIGKLFPVLDSLDRSIQTGSQATAHLEGVKLVRTQLEQTLTEYGLERIRSVGQRFDPEQHEAVDVVRVEISAEHGRVVEEWAAGYRLGNRVLRAAKVRVGKLH